MENEKRKEFIEDYFKFLKSINHLSKDIQKNLTKDYIIKHDQDIPKKLYKYRECNEQNLNSLRNKKAWFSNPITWNDKIDVTILFELKDDLNDLIKSKDKLIVKYTKMLIDKVNSEICDNTLFLKEINLEEIYNEMFEESGDFNNEKAYKYFLLKFGEEPTKCVIDNIKKAINILNKENFDVKLEQQISKIFSINKIKESFLMYSLSESYTNSKQWADYANEGTGFCICYEIKDIIKQKNFTIDSLLPIYYGEKNFFSITNFLDDAIYCFFNGGNDNELAMEIITPLMLSLYTKDFQWIGEEEWRITVNNIEKLKGKNISFNYVVSIYLGENIKEYWKKRLINIAREQRLKVYQRELDYTGSKWIYKEVNIF